MYLLHRIQILAGLFRLWRRCFVMLSLSKHLPKPNTGGKILRFAQDDKKGHSPPFYGLKKLPRYLCPNSDLGRTNRKLFNRDGRSPNRGELRSYLSDARRFSSRVHGGIGQSVAKKTQWVANRKNRTVAKTKNLLSIFEYLCKIRTLTQWFPPQSIFFLTLFFIRFPAKFSVFISTYTVKKSIQNKKPI